MLTIPEVKAHLKTLGLGYIKMCNSQNQSITIKVGGKMVQGIFAASHGPIDVTDAAASSSGDSAY